MDYTTKLSNNTNPSFKMTREEEITKEAKKFAKEIDDWEIAEDVQDAFEAGAQWADDHPKQIEISLEDIEELAKEVIPEDWVERQETLWDMIRRNQRAQFITKACEWIEYVFKELEISGIDDWVESFKNAMKGE